MNPDAALLHLLNGMAGVSPALDWLVRAIVNDYALPTLFALVLGALWFVGETEAERAKIQRAILLTMLSIAVCNIVMRLGQNFYFRSRPFASEPVHLLFYRPSVSSFPSVPVATMFVYVAGLWSAHRTASRWLLALAILFGVSRVIAGVHYPSDIIGGAALGIICTWFVFRYARFLEPLVTRIIALTRRLDLA